MSLSIRQHFTGRRRLFTVAVLLGIVAVAALSGLFSTSRPPATLTATVDHANIEETVLATGTLQAAKLVSVGAQASGQLKSLKVALGQAVQKGDLLAEIDPVLQQNDLRDARSNLDVAEAQVRAKVAQLAQLKLDLHRQQIMAAAEASPRADLENAQASVTTTEAERAAQEAQARKARVQVDKAEANLAYTRIVAPMDGEVVAIVTQEGQTIVSVQAAPTILKLAKLDSMTIKAQISEADMGRVRHGQAVYFTVMGDPDKRFNGTLRAIEPAPESLATETAATASQQSSSTAVYYNALFGVPNPDRALRIGMTAQVFIVIGEAKNALSIPVSALGARDKDGSYTVQVQTADGGRERRRIRTGVSDRANIQVLEGLDAGEKIVVAQAPAQPTEKPFPPGRR